MTQTTSTSSQNSLKQYVISLLGGAMLIKNNCGFFLNSHPQMFVHLMPVMRKCRPRKPNFYKILIQCSLNYVFNSVIIFA
jgi:hypothetical protein